MASTVRLLLRLPPAIRQQLISQEPSASFCLRNRILFQPNGSRPFRLTTCLAKQGGKGKAIYRNAQPQKPTPSARDLPKPGISPPSTSISRAPVAQAAPLLRKRPRFSSSDWMETRFGDAERVVLYVAPRHGAFFALSYIVAGVFVLYGFVTAWNSQQLLRSSDRSKSWKAWLYWYIHFTMAALPLVFVTALCTAAALGPRRMIKSVTAVRPTVTSPTPQLPWLLRFEVKRLAPGAAPLVVKDVAPEQVFVNKNVKTTAEAINYINIDLKDSATFTERYFSGELLITEGSLMSRVNRGLVNAWPILKRETKRLMLRDQMVYIGIKGVGNLKLDLQGAMLLDSGRVMDKLVQEDTSSRPSIQNFFKQLLGG